MRILISLDVFTKLLAMLCISMMKNHSLLNKMV